MTDIMQKWLRFFLVAASVFAIDQLAKAWVVSSMAVGETIKIIPPLVPYFQLTRVTNTGIAFGMFTGGNLVLLVLTSIVVVVLLLIYRSLPPHLRLQQIAFAMIIGWALGNIADRIRFGHVVDFVHVIIPNLISNVSNFADHFVVIGVLLILLDTFLQERREHQKISESEPLSPEVNP
jgi:signal peptidase II